MGTSVATCICWPPARSAPKRKPAMTTPAGWDLPNNAREMASKPRPAANPGVARWSTPEMMSAPARPPSAPATAITAT